MQKLIAVKPFRYSTRMLRPGDIFEARPRDARLLVAIKKAAPLESRPVGKIAPPPAKVAEKIAAKPAPEKPQLDHDQDGKPGGSKPAADRGDDLAALRAEYERLTGESADKRWGAPRLNKEIAAAK